MKRAITRLARAQARSNTTRSMIVLSSPRPMVRLWKMDLGLLKSERLFDLCLAELLQIGRHNSMRRGVLHKP